MERKELLEKIETVEPALANNELIPVLTMLWFTGTHLMCYNDNIGISVPFKTDFAAAVAPTLSQLLRNSAAKYVELSLDGDTLRAKAASSNIKLSTLPASDFIFEMPVMRADKATFPKAEAKALIEGLGFCLRSVGNDVSVPDQLGVTIIPRDDGFVNLFSTNDKTLCCSSVKSRTPLKKRVILSADFCRQLIRFGKSESLAIDITEEYSLAQVGKTMIYGRLIYSDNPVRFEEMMNAHLPKKAKLVPMPSRLRMAIERAIVITSSKTATTKTEVTVNDSHIQLSSKSDRGSIQDRVAFEDSGHPPASITLDPAHLRIGQEGADKILFTERAAILSKGSSVFMIAALNE